jgi:glycosyltransferase involved in cell wall biosynthesis
MRAQTLKPDHWIVLDNTQGEGGWNLSELFTLHTHAEPLTIAQMRNKCLELALDLGCEFIVFWDDDDYYPPMRIQVGVEALKAGSPLQISPGTSFMYMMLTELNALMSVGPYHDKHRSSGRADTARQRSGNDPFDDRTFGEEASFPHDWAAALIQVDPMDTIAVMGREANAGWQPDVFWQPRPLLGQGRERRRRETGVPVRGRT